MNEQELIRQARNEYMKRYRANNKEKIAAINARYLLRKSIEALKNNAIQNN